MWVTAGTLSPWQARFPPLAPAGGPSAGWAAWSKNPGHAAGLPGFESYSIISIISP